MAAAVAQWLSKGAQQELPYKKKTFFPCVCKPFFHNLNTAAARSLIFNFIQNLSSYRENELFEKNVLQNHIVITVSACLQLPQLHHLNN